METVQDIAPAMTPTKVLFLTRKWPPAVGGMETYAVEMTAGLEASGFAVDVIALPGRRDGRPPGAGELISFGLCTGLRLLFEKHSDTVVFGGDLAIWPLVWAACKRSNAQAILAAHGTDISLAGRSDLRGRIYATYLEIGRRMLPGLRIVANSDATTDRLRKRGFVEVTTVPLGCRVSVQDPDRDLARSLLFAGRLVTRKGLSWFVQAVLPDLPADIRLAVAGTPWDTTEERALRHPRVDFLGALPQPELHRKMAGALAVVIPNIQAGPHQFEGFGLIAAEAAAAGGLVLASRLDGYETSVVDGETGSLLPPGDREAWIAAIRAIAALPDGQREIRKMRAQEAATRKFDWARTVNLTEVTFL